MENNKEKTIKKTIKPVAETKKVAPKKTSVKEAGFSVDVMGLDGKAAGKITLPKEVFGAKVNKALMAQAVRVYLANQRQGTSSTKTRGEVAGTTKKVYRQKGTGRARHGAAKAPIFIGGGITFGPKPRDFSLSLPKRMKKAALHSSLTAQFSDNRVIVVDSVDSVSGKTSDMAKAFKGLQLLNKQGKGHKVLFVITGKEDMAKRAVKNMNGVITRNVVDLTTYEVLNSSHLVFVKNSIELLSKGENK